MKIAILGGSFDPPHFGHLLIAEQIREQLAIDEVWLMPLFQKKLQDKVFHKFLSPVVDRLRMTKLIARNSVKASNFEIITNKTSYSQRTLQELKKKYPENTFYWILGSDQLDNFQKYYQWQKLIRSQNLIIFPREHTLWHIEQKVKEVFQLQTIPENVIVLKNQELILSNISSTVIRNRVKNDLPIDFLVPEKIEKYILEHNLYK